MIGLLVLMILKVWIGFGFFNMWLKFISYGVRFVGFCFIKLFCMNIMECILVCNFGLLNNFF